MNSIDFASINAALDGETVVPQWLSHGHKRGQEWVAANPTRSDTNAGSFTINMKKGVWKDYATGEGGADLVSLYAYLFCGGNQGEAARELAANRGIKIAANEPRIDAPNVKRIEDAAPTPIIPVPADVPACISFKHPTHGEASMVWQYLDTNGQLLMYVCRFDPVDGSRKQISPRSWCAHPGKPSRWTWRGITGKAKRPLYGLDRLAAMPDGDVILVEGEKAADAGQELFAGVSPVISWMGGTETAERADVSPLAGRRVILFPDHDAQRYKLTKQEADEGVDADSKPVMPLHEQPGLRAMMAIAKNLKGIASEIIMVGYTPDPACGGWDLADAQEAGWDGEKVLRYIGKNAGDPWHIASGKKAQADAPKAAPTPANDNEPNVPLEYDVNVFGFPHRSEKEQPKNTVENLEYMLGEYGISCRYNQTRKAVELNMPGKSYTIDNQANAAFAELLSLSARNRMPASNLQDYVKLIADRNAYNPVCDWIKSKPWDRVTRIQSLLDTVQCSGDAKLKDALMYRWLLSAVAAVFQPFDFEGHGCLVFTGAQGIGKTTWFRRLVPSGMRLVLVGAMLDPADKDSVTNAVSHWIVELGELDATFRKADIARLKSFIPKPDDKLRRPYDRIESEYQRRTIFCASVNDDKYLVDDTGNRRWWTIPVTGIDYRHNIDMQQVWAELLTHFERGEQWHLTPEENAALGELNAEHEAVDPVEEMILSAFDWDKPSITSHNMTASEVLIALGYDKPSKVQATHVSKVLEKLTGKKAHRTGKGRFFAMPSAPRARRQQERSYADREDKPW